MPEEKSKKRQDKTIEEIEKIFNEVKKLSAKENDKCLKLLRKIVKLAKQENLTNEMLRAYLNLSFVAIRSGDDQRCLYNVRKVLKIATEIGDQLHQENALTKLGAYYWNHSNYKKARHYFERGLALQSKMKSYDNNPVIRGLAMSYIKLNQWDKADKLLRKGQLYAKKKGDEIELANLIYWKGFLEYERTHYDLALQYYMKSLKLYEQSNFTAGQSLCFNSIGLLYREIGESDQALAYFQKSKDKAMCEEKESVNRLADVYNNIGLIHSDVKEYEPALANYKKSLEYRQTTGEISKEAITLLNIGNIFSYQKKYDLAHEYIAKALKLKRRVGNIKELSYGLHSAITTYCQKNDLLSAEKYVVELTSLLDKMFNKDIQIKAYNLLAEFFEKKGDYAKALEYSKKFHKESQELFDEKTRKRIYDEEYKRKLERVKLRNKYKLEKDRIKTVLALSCTTSHELNQPLMVIQGNLDLLQMKYGDVISERDKVHIENVYSSIERIRDILDKLNKVQQVSFSKYYQSIDMLEISREESLQSRGRRQNKK